MLKLSPADLEYRKCSASDQRRWLTLADAFAASEGAKSVGGIARTNSVTDVTTGDCYLFERLSRANHSCEPNMRFTLPAFAFDGGMVTLSMLQNVTKGSELTISYLGMDDLAKSTAERRAILKDKFNFVCECSRCGAASARLERTGGSQGDQVSTGQCARRPPPELPMRQQELKALETAEAALSSHLQACAALLSESPVVPPPVSLLQILSSCANALRATEGARREILLGRRE